MTSSAHSHSHSHPHSHEHEPHHDIHPHTDLDALGEGEGTEAVVHAGALRTERVAQFLEAQFGDVEVVETREVEAGEAR